jgi:hypothetical protein
LASPSSFECEEGKIFTKGIHLIVRFAKIEELTRLVLERLQSGIFRRRARLTTRLGVMSKNLWRSRIPITKTTKNVLMQNKDSLKHRQKFAKPQKFTMEEV